MTQSILKSHSLFEDDLADTCPSISCIHQETFLRELGLAHMRACLRDVLRRV